MDYASVYITISKFIETVAKDLRKADLTLRNGQNHLAKSTELKKELAKLEREYENFDKRVLEESKRVQSELSGKIHMQK